jgi:hypothetical protein
MLRTPLVALLVRWLGGLRFPVLMLVTALLFVADLVVPDLIPLADEVLLGLATLLLASWRKRRLPDAERERRG